MPKQYDARIRLKSDTTANWYSNISFIPLAGEAIIYTDYESKTENGDTVLIPGIKIGDGKTYGVDLPFVGDDIRDEIMAHIADGSLHVTSIERMFWNNKINVNDSQEVINGVLVFNRN